MEVTPQTLKDFHQLTKEKNVLFFIGSKTCSFCKILKDEWESLAIYMENTFNNKEQREQKYLQYHYTRDIVLAHMDGDEYPELNYYFQIDSYPSIFYIANDFFYSYDKFQPKDFETLRMWAIYNFKRQIPEPSPYGGWNYFKIHREVFYHMLYRLRDFYENHPYGQHFLGSVGFITLLTFIFGRSFSRKQNR